MWEEKYIFSIFSFVWVNYIFDKLSSNTMYVQFQLHIWACGEILLKMSCKFIFLVAPTCNHVAQIAQGLKGKVPTKKFVLPISWIFTFSNCCCCSWFYMMPSPMWFLGYEYKGFEFFSKSFTSSMVFEFLVKNPLEKKFLPHSYLQI
jgi:hypothetical protein